MCTKYNALFYLQNWKATDEMKLYSNNYFLPEIAETQQWCDPGKQLALLKVSIAFLLQVSAIVTLGLSLM